MSQPGIPLLNFDQIRDDFAFLDDWEDRYRYLIELGRKLEPLPESARTPQNKVSGCASQVWLTTQVEDGTLHFIGDSDAHIVRGLIAVLIALVNGRTPEEIASVDAISKFSELGLEAHLSAQRSNGLRAMIQRVRADAEAARNSTVN